MVLGGMEALFGQIWAKMGHFVHKMKINRGPKGAWEGRKSSLEPEIQIKIPEKFFGGL